MTPLDGSLTMPADDLPKMMPYLPVTFTFAPTAGSGYGMLTAQSSSCAK